MDIRRHGYEPEWEKQLSKTSFIIIGPDRTGKTADLVYAAWESSPFNRTIAVCKASDDYVTGEWDCTARIPFTSEGLSILGTIIDSVEGFSVLLEFNFWEKGRTNREVKAENRSLAALLTEIVCRTKTPMRLILDAYEFYPNEVLARVESKNPLVCPLYVFNSVGQLMEANASIPVVRGHIFTKIHSRVDKEYAANVFGNAELVEGLWSDAQTPACIVDGVVLPDNRDT